MSFVNQILFKLHFFINIFCLLMVGFLILFLGINFGLFMIISLGLSVIGVVSYVLTKAHEMTDDIFTVGALTSSLSLSVISKLLLFIAIRIEMANFMYFALALLMFTFITFLIIRKKFRIRKLTFTRLLKRVVFATLLFTFLYQIILGYFLRPNFLVTLSLLLSQVSQGFLAFTYFHLKYIYRDRSRI